MRIMKHLESYKLKGQSVVILIPESETILLVVTGPHQAPRVVVEGEEVVVVSSPLSTTSQETRENEATDYLNCSRKERNQTSGIH